MPVIMLAKGLQLLLEPLPAPRVQPARLLFSLSKWPLNSLTEGSVLCVFTWQAPWGVCCVKQQRWEQKQVFSTPPPTAVSPSTPALLPVPPLIHSFSLSFLPLLLFLHELLLSLSSPPTPMPFFFLSLMCVLAHSPIHTCFESTTWVSFSSYPCKSFWGLEIRSSQLDPWVKSPLPFILEERWRKSDKVPSV